MTLLVKYTMCACMPTQVEPAKRWWVAAAVMVNSWRINIATMNTDFMEQRICLEFRWHNEHH